MTKQILLRVLAAALLLLVSTTALAALAVDVNRSTGRSSSSTTIAATPAFATAAGNELLLAFIATDGPASGATTVTSVGGGGLTWTLVVRANAQAGSAEVWRAFAVNPLTNVTVTATLSRWVAASITVLSFTGVDTTGTSGSGAVGASAGRSAATGAPSASLVTTRDNSWVFGVGTDWDGATARTVAAGQTMIFQYLATVGDTYWVQSQTAPSPAAGTTATIADTAPANHRFNLAIIEVVPAQATGPAPLSVALTEPSAGASVAGVTTVSAVASDGTSPIAGVQFKLDGQNLGAEDTSAPYSVPWDTTASAEGTHTLIARARNQAGATLDSTPRSVSVVNLPLASIGRWDAPFDLGIVAVNSVLLHTGKVLMYSGSFTTSYTERVWDPATGLTTLVPNSFYNIFCSGQAQLADGRILVVGGFGTASVGAKNANIFDPVTQTWTAVPDMAYARWYPTATTLPDGRVLVTSGAQTCLTCLADLPEIYDPVTNRFTTVTTARLAVPYYPFMFVLPDGSVVDAGANEQPTATSKLNLTSGTWSSVDPIVRTGHSAAMYLPGKIIKSGTPADSGTAGNAQATAFVIDMNQPTPSWRQVASMANARAFQNTTLLPDGTVLVTGGGTALDGYDVSKSIFAAELWSPVTETWRTLASASVPRLYHSTALLLPDGRVLSAGSGMDGPAIDQTAGQIFSPPYLFKGARPTIGAVPDTLAYGGTFTVSTPDSASIASVSLIRPGSVTHAFDEDQRYVPLTFTANSAALTVQAPANANLAPPGYYLLFIVNANGVPSIAKFVHFDAPGADAIPPTPPGNLTAAGGIGTAELAWTASTDDTGVTLYNVHRSTVSGFAPSAGNKIGQSTATSYTDQTGAAGTYFYLVTARDVAGNVSDPSNEAPVVVLADTTPPTVSITAPQPQATVTGAITVAAIGSDDVSLAGIQFQLDGNALGTERTAPPYSVIWNSMTTSNGQHTLSAVARDATGNRTTATVDVSVFNNSSIPAGLVAAYGFNEGSGVQAQDSSGQNNVGTLGGATWTNLGKFGKALSFNGTDAWVTIADANSLDLTTGMTIEAWINPSAGTGWRTVVLKEGPGQLMYSLYSANNASRPAAYVRTTDDVIANGTAAIPLNTWTHVAMTYDGTALRLFVNGTLVRTTTGHGASTSAGAVRIGGNSVWGEYFRGIIDEVRIYNRALTGGEIQADMATAIQ